MVLARVLCPFVVIALAAGILGCSSPASSNQPPTDGELRSMIAEAARASGKDLRVVSEQGVWGTELLDKVADQPLTVAILVATQPLLFCRDQADYVTNYGPPPEFAVSPPGIVNPVAISRCLECPPSMNDEYQKLRSTYPAREFYDHWPYASLIWEEYITEIQSEIKDDTISGSVSFAVSECFNGNIPFVANKASQGWRVDEFTLPNMGWRTVRQEDGIWKTLPMEPFQSIPDLNQLDTVIDGWPVFGPSPSSTRLRKADPSVTVLQVARGGELQFLGPHDGLTPAPDPLSRIGGRPVVIVPRPNASFGDVISALKSLQTIPAPPSAIGLPTEREIENAWYLLGVVPSTGRISAAGPVSLLSSGVPIRFSHSRRPLAQVWVGATITRLSTGTEMALPISTVEEIVTFASTVVARYPGRDFLLVADLQANYENVDRALDALMQAEVPRIFLATDRYSGLLLWRRGPFEADPEIESRDQQTQVAASAPPQQPESTIRFVVGGNITEPKKIAGPKPRYPDDGEAKTAGIKGVVVLQLTISQTGDVTNVKALRPLPLGLTEAAVEAAGQWKFEPGRRKDNGVAVDLLYIMTVRFNLPENTS